MTYITLIRLLQYYDKSFLTIIISHNQFRYTTTLSVNTSGSAQEWDNPLKETILAGKMKWCVTITIRDKRVSISFKKILNHFMLTSDDC